MRKIWAFVWYQNLQKFEKKVEKIGLDSFKSLPPSWQRQLMWMPKNSYVREINRAYNLHIQQFHFFFFFFFLKPMSSLSWQPGPEKKVYFSGTKARKMKISLQDCYISDYFLCFSLFKTQIFPIKWQHFPPSRGPSYWAFPAVLSATHKDFMFIQPILVTLQKEVAFYSLGTVVIPGS